jgi:hypothetical protein
VALLVVLSLEQPNGVTVGISNEMAIGSFTGILLNVVIHPLGPVAVIS